MRQGSGWYSEILSKYLKNSNGFYVSKYKFPPVKVVGEKIKKSLMNILVKIKINLEKLNHFFSKKNILESNIKEFDLILTFRNTHNWLI